MKFAEITASVLVDESNKEKAAKELHTAQDRLALDRVPIFASSVSSKSVCGVENEEEVRADAEADEVEQETCPPQKKGR